MSQKQNQQVQQHQLSFDPARPPLLVTVPDAAYLIQADEYTVRKLVRRGVLAHRVIGKSSNRPNGNKWLISYASVMKYGEGSTKFGSRS